MRVLNDLATACNGVVLSLLNLDAQLLCELVSPCQLAQNGHATQANACTVDLCRTPAVVGNGLILELPCYPGISSFYLNPAWCDVSVTKIEMWDGTDPYFWTNFVGETESI